MKKNENTNHLIIVNDGIGNLFVLHVEVRRLEQEALCPDAGNVGYARCNASKPKRGY